MRAFGLLGVVIVLAVGLFMYQRSIQELPDENPLETIDTIAIRQRLLTIGQTERQFQVTNGHYGTLEELAAADLLPGGTQQRGYTYTASVTPTSFVITATPTAEDKEGWPTLEITETMEVKEK
jgi:hypothetical protein